MSSLTKSSNQGKKSAIRSLQSQYIFVALLLGCLVLTGSTLGYINIITTSSELSSQADTTSRVLGLTTNMREDSSNSYSIIQTFMLDPDYGSHKKQLLNEITQIRQNLHLIAREPLIKQLGLKDKTTEVSEQVDKLKTAALHLFDVRIATHQQYPALDISTQQMNPASHEILSALKLTLLEYRDNTLLQDLQTREYALLNEALVGWMNTIAAYRLYLSNRMGSFDSLEILEQESIVDSHIKLIEKIATQLVELNQQQRFDFQGSNLITQLPLHIQQWKNGFTEVKRINQSGEWRQDNMLLNKTIIPLIQAINHNLKNIDYEVKHEYQRILEDKTFASTKQNYILIGIILLFLIYIIISIKLLQHFIIKPIASIASTMKNEAYHHNGFHLPNFTRTRETQDLIDAFSEMSHQVFKRQDELEYQAMHDSLTGLPNRLMLHQRLDYHLLISSREKQNLIFMMLDLNRFKEINDTLGHHIGDNLLVQVGERILRLLRNVDTVARLGGDEFALLLPNTNRSQARIVANSINRALEKTFIVNDYELQISASIGIAECPNDGTDSHILMQHADVAMYIAKREKSGYHYYSVTEDSHSIGRLSLGSDLKSAIENNQLELKFQPKYSMQSAEITGAEALLRWNHPDSGAVSPEVIVDLAEEMGVINELSNWVIENAIRFCAKHTKEHPECTISINLSVHNLRDPNLLSNINYWLLTHNLDSSRICFEITESAMMTNPEKSIQVLNKLHKLGIKLSVDDFGTGFSSLAYLKLLPVSELKIDKSFVMDILHDESDRLIVHSTIELSHNLGINVVAEGIESKECWNMLQEMGCDSAQGYYMSKPISESEMGTLLKSPSNRKGNFSSLTKAV